MPETPLPHDHGQALAQEVYHMPRTDDFQTVADVFKLLGDGNRICIFWLLYHCEACAINLPAMVQMSRPAVSHHWKQWKAGALVVSHRGGKEVYCKAADTETAQLLHHTIVKQIRVLCHTENAREEVLHET